MKRARRELTDMRVVIAENYKEKEPLTQYQKDSCKCFWEYGKHIDEHLQALEIIVKKKIDMQTMRYTVVAIMFKTNEERLEEYNLCVDSSLVLTQEEYDLVSKVVKEIGENE